MDMIDVDDHDGFLPQADGYLTRGCYGQALELAKDRLKKSPRDPEAAMIICQSWLGMGNLEEARAAFSALDGMLLRLARLYKVLGDICLQKGLKREAAAYFQKGLLLLPEAFEPHQQSQIMTDVWQAFAGDHAESDAEDEGHAVSPDFYTLTMADLYIKQGHLDMAVEILEAIGEREPDNTAVLSRLQEVRKRMGGHPTAQTAMEQADVTDSPAVAPSAAFQPAVVRELSRWLNNIHRIRSHVPQASRNA